MFFCDIFCYTYTCDILNLGKSMKIDDALLSKLEKLSSLEVETSKRQEIIEQLSEIVNFVENLNELDLDEEEASFTTVKGGSPFRKDLSTTSEDVVKTILENAPKSNDRFFSVPSIIE